MKLTIEQQSAFADIWNRARWDHAKSLAPERDRTRLQADRDQEVADYARLCSELGITRETGFVLMKWCAQQLFVAGIQLGEHNYNPAFVAGVISGIGTLRVLIEEG